MIQDISKTSNLLGYIKENSSKDMISYYWLGEQPYNKTWDLQRSLHHYIVNEVIGDIVLLLEHPHVYTLGKNANNNHLLPSYPKDAEVIDIDRGGDVTYHGPGQLVGYPILDLHNYKMSISWYLDVLSNSIINMLTDLDIDSHYRNDYVGVWVDESKIAAFGVRLSKWITMHGFALNINTDLKYYDGLIPCGIFECGITSISDNIKTKFSVQEIAKIYSKYFVKHLNGEV